MANQVEIQPRLLQEVLQQADLTCLGLAKKMGAKFKPTKVEQWLSKKLSRHPTQTH